MSAASFLAMHLDPTGEQIDRAMSANLRRCGAHVGVRAAIKTAAARLRGA
jgi:isoquinoline 1-oxidoreductase alpha subunit